MEIAYIEFYNSVEEGYNLAIGGSGNIGYKHTEEWKETASLRMLGNKNGLGKSKSEEEKQYLSEIQMNHFVSEETKRKIGDKNSKAIIQFSKDGEYISEYKSAAEAASILGLNRRAISACCSGTSKSSGGFI